MAVGAAWALTIAPSAVAQADKTALPLTPSYQISAWAFFNSATNVAERGCYIIDTSTGELWVAHADGAPKRVAGKLK